MNRTTKAKTRSGTRGIKTRTSPRAAVSMRCAYCHDDLPREDRRFCAGCMAPHHAECWDEHGMCSAGGCDELAWVETTTERRTSPKKKKKRRSRTKRGPSQARIESEANTALVLGLVALVACGLMGPFAISRANAVTTMARQARVPVPGSATAGLVMGWVGSVGLVLSLGIVVLQLGVFAAL